MATETYDPWHEVDLPVYEDNCYVKVYVADVPRYTGGPRRFQMHYNERQCRRKKTYGNRCSQHRIWPDFDTYFKANFNKKRNHA